MSTPITSWHMAISCFSLHQPSLGAQAPSSSCTCPSVGRAPHPARNKCRRTVSFAFCCPIALHRRSSATPPFPPALTRAQLLSNLSPFPSYSHTDFNPHTLLHRTDWYLTVKFGMDAVAIGLLFSFAGLVTVVTQGFLLKTLVPVGSLAPFLLRPSLHLPCRLFLALGVSPDPAD